ncbi:putative LPS assembly protein LptD [Pontimicrobium aquaticum]|uniref:LPS-assembly protein LptD n=1 Tax=Pontimicrobium aquaticum TaxID=2565367 RepID=A0A4U0EKA0_9FLAO|nr:putative LPS assembly protein LptD [Pontimicrobium aquaticum]TJY31865.1 LPS-assembly protein LptD [Pontimicrobium aquaticum]
MAIQKPSHTFTKIHLKALQTNIFQILFALSFTVFINTFGFAQDIPPKKKGIKPLATKDSVSAKVDSLKTRNTITAKIETDTIKIDSLNKKPKLLKDIVKYSASGYTSVTRRDQKITLYDNAKINYEDMEITAGVIIIDYEKNEVYAKGIVDSLNNYTQKPVFTQGSDVVEPDSIRFNTDTQKALIFNSRTEQSGGYIIAETTKKENDSVYFIDRGKFTTSKDLEDPEYYFLMRKAKIVPGKKVVTGLTNMFIANVPTPIGLPFAYFPLTQKRTSGVIFPSFGEQNNRGYFLQNGGYYFAVSDYFDLALLGDYYTNGSYGMRVESNYAKRYRFRGNLSFRFENLINSERGFPDYSRSSIYNIRWSHSQDAKANPNSRFSASVNLGSSRYYQQSINQLNASNYLNNTLSSSVSYSKTFQGEPQVNISLTATHSQNTNTQTINMTLPTFQGSVGRIFPFAPKGGTKKGIIQNINLQYNTRAENRIQTTDSLFFKKEMFEDAKVGMQHSIPLSTNFKLFDYLSVSAGANFQETWTLNTIEKSFDQATQETVITEKNGFDSFRTYNFSASLGTTLYGMFPFGEDKKIQAIRHVMRPSISYNISPAFNQYYDTYEVISADNLTTTEQEYTRFEQSIFGSPTNNYASSIGISVSNNFEAKVRDRDSTATEPKKITLLNNLNFSTSYNLAGDSLNWSPVRVSGGTKLFKQMNVNFGATLDPYALDSNNNKINTFNIDNGGSLFRLTSANLTTSYSFSNSKSKNDDDRTNSRAQEESRRSGGRDDDLFGKSQDFADKSFNDNEDNAEETSTLYRYKIPWNLRLAYAVNYSNTRRQNEISSHSLMFSGDIELSPRWKVGVSSGYDLKNQGITYTQLRFDRDLKSWRMNFSWIPFSANKQWNFFIGIKSSILQDIKYEKRRQRDRDL